MYLNPASTSLLVILISVEPKHKMYLNSNNLCNSLFSFLVEPKHKMYLNEAEKLLNDFNNNSRT